MAETFLKLKQALSKQTNQECIQGSFSGAKIK
jgi:hypothetical protein